MKKVHNTGIILLRKGSGRSEVLLFKNAEGLWHCTVIKDSLKPLEESIEWIKKSFYVATNTAFIERCETFERENLSRIFSYEIWLPENYEQYVEMECKWFDKESYKILELEPPWQEILDILLK